ncbi:MAG: site-specific integrase [Clostridiales bacterium]|nr:site-specific integrase [Clostridiales bacterium]
MGRRGENIRKRQDGRWEARVVQGKPICGKTNYKYFYGSSYQDVRQKKKSFLENRQLMRLDVIPSLPEKTGMEDTPFRDVVTGWLLSKKSGVKESTYSCYSIMAEKHILPVLGELPVSSIDSSCLTKFLEKKKISGRLGGGALSDKTISDMKTVLMQILRFAKKQGMLRTVPDCPSMTSRQPDASVLTAWEQTKVEAKVLEEDTPFGLGVLLSLYGGIRIGEVCGLQWKDIDGKNGTLSINKTVYRITDMDGQNGAKTKVVIGTPKTDCSIRTIPLPITVFQYLMERRRDGDCYVVTGTTKYMEPRVCLERYKRLLHRAGVADHTFHTLRHTYATRCVESGVDIKSLSEIMGHSDVKITLQRYVHPSMDMKKAQVNKLSCFHAGGQISGHAYQEIA